MVLRKKPVERCDARPAPQCRLCPIPIGWQDLARRLSRAAVLLASVLLVAGSGSNNAWCQTPAVGPAPQPAPVAGNEQIPAISGFSNPPAQTSASVLAWEGLPVR